MKLLKVVFFVFLFSSCVAAKTAKQDPYLKHTIEKGETVFSIAKKYHVTPFDIYRLNPDAKEGIKENTTLLIPKAVSVSSFNDDADVKTHKVAPKETLFSLAKQYGVTVLDLKEWNPDVEKNGLKIGQELIVSKNYKTSNLVDKVEVEEVKSTSLVSTHVVKTGETLYSLSKKYDIKIDDLIALNPQLESGLNIGDTIKVKRENQIKITEIQNNEKLYTVKPKETLYSLSKQFNLSSEELIALNPDLKEGLKEGMTLKLPSKIRIKDSIALKPKANLLQSVDYNSQKEIVLLLPFGLNKIESDTTKTVKDHLKNNKFFNLTLDFYSGALIAIDSAKTLGLPVKIKILDVESTKNSTNIASVISRNNMSNVNAIIGPFMNSHAETTAQLLSQYNIPVISPLSKEVSKPISNLYNAVPSQEELIASLFDYMNSKEGNIVAIISSKKNASREMLQSKYSYVKFPEANENGTITIDAIKSQLVKGKKNFVILDSEKSGQIMNVSGNLMKLKNEFDIQLVVFELYDSLNFEEIPMKNLTELNLLFPSVTKEPMTMEEKIVIRKLTDANQVSPNYFVLKGFDVTFDTILRVCQQDGYEQSVQQFSSEGVENGFNYVIENGVNMNKQIYIQYYDTDYKIKRAN